MPFQRPTLQELISRIQADMDSRIPGADPRLRRSLLAVLARAHSGAMHSQYGYKQWIADQVMPDTADDEQLERWANIWDVQRLQATAAAGDVEFTGTDGATIPAGTELQTGDGTSYTTDADATIAGGTATAAVTASEAGENGNQEVGVSLNLVSPLSGVDSQATVAGDGLTGGTDEESDDRLLGRLLDRVRRPPHGGAKSDYERWALEVNGVSRAFVFPLHVGEGTVGIAILDDSQDPPIPGQTKVDEVQAYIDERRPVTAEVNVYTPTPVDLDLTIELTPNTAAVREAVEAELADLILREAEPGGTILLSRLNEAISIAEGEEDHTLVSPTDDVTHNTNEIAVLGTITWQ